MFCQKKTDYEIDDPNIINIQKVKDSIVVGYLFNDGESMGYIVFTQKEIIFTAYSNVDKMNI